MSELTFPDNVRPSRMSLNLVSNSVIYTSQFNNSVNTHNFPGARWKATLEFDNIDNFSVKEIDILQVFLWQLEGVNGRFWMHDFSKPGSPTKGSPVVSLPDQYGTLLPTSGWTPNSLVVPAARYFSVNGELKFATKDLYSDAIGNCNLEFTPPLRTPPPQGSEINTDRPKGMFRLLDNNQGNFNLSPGLEGSVTLEVVEAFHV